MYYLWHKRRIFNIGSSGIPGGYFGNNGGNNGYYPEVSHQINQPNYGSYGGSQSSANANANANANAIANGNGGVHPSGSSYYPSGPQAIGNANANANADANAGANVLGSDGVNVNPNNYPSGGIDRIEVIPVNTLPLSRPTSSIHSIPHQQSLNDKEDVIVVVEETPQYPPYHRPSPSYHRQHRRPHYGGKPKQQPIEIIIIEEPARPNPGDISSSTLKSHHVIIDSLGF